MSCLQRRPRHAHLTCCSLVKQADVMSFADSRHAAQGDHCKEQLSLAALNSLSESGSPPGLGFPKAPQTLNCTLRSCFVCRAVRPAATGSRTAPRCLRCCLRWWTLSRSCAQSRGIRAAVPVVATGGITDGRQVCWGWGQ